MEKKEDTMSATFTVEKAIECGSAQHDLDHDGEQLAQLGYKQEFKREASLFFQLAFAFLIMNATPMWLVGFGTAMSGGGPVASFWGLIIVSPFIICIALSMAEAFSAFPVNGGVYSWCFLLSNEKWGPFMSWLCGYVFLAAGMSAPMILAATMADFIIGLANMFRDDPITNRGARVGMAIGIVIAGSAYTYLGMKANNYLNKFMMFWVVIGTVLIVTMMPAMSPSHPPAKWVFTSFQNTTGFENKGQAFLIGMLQAGWTFISYEYGAHFAEGTKNASVNGPIGLISAAICGIIQVFILCIATLFSIQDANAIVMSDSPVATLFEQATNRSVAAFLLVIIILSEFGAICNALYGIAQMVWAMARDKALPYHEYWYSLDGKHQVPIRVLVLVQVVCVVFLLPILGSDVYWSVIMSICVVCFNITYALPFFCRLIWKRHDMPKGPFDLGRFSVPVNAVTVIWVVFLTVIMCLPTVNPVTPESMNYTCLMLGSAVIIALVFWFAYGRTHYKGPAFNADD